MVRLVIPHSATRPMHPDNANVALIRMTDGRIWLHRLANERY
jgi:hypothetical protein